MELPLFNKEGHRGTRGLMPENTIPSMYKAIDYDVNTVEVDVVISKDRQVVISHDVYFHPDITTTPGGISLTSKEAQAHLLYEMDYDSIRKYDVGLKPHPDFPQQQKIPTYKPLLGELIDSTDWYAKKKGKTILYNIELKTNPANDGKKHPPVEEFVDLVMNVVKEKKIESRCYLQSFDFRPLQLLHNKYPGIVTAVLISGNDKRSFDQQLQELGYNPGMYSPHYSVVTKELVENCHKKNIKIIPWTVNSVEEMKKMKALGVDGIITDYPNYFSQL
jgi:glycerophosphoryl diester phosphodiesterase